MTTAQPKKPEGLAFALPAEDQSFCINESQRLGIQYEKVVAALLRSYAEKTIKKAAEDVAEFKRVASYLDTLPPGSLKVEIRNPIPRPAVPKKIIRPLKDPKTGEHVSYQLYTD